MPSGLAAKASAKSRTPLVARTDAQIASALRPHMDDAVRKVARDVSRKAGEETCKPSTLPTGARMLSFPV